MACAGAGVTITRCVFESNGGPEAGAVFAELCEGRGFDAEAAANDPELGVKIPKDEDIAGLNRRAAYAPVYVVKDGGDIQQYILPVRGKGLWSTLYGYLSVAPDGNTVAGLRFYEHAETPGLGDKIELPSFKKNFAGMYIF